MSGQHHLLNGPQSLKKLCGIFAPFLKRFVSIREECPDHCVLAFIANHASSVFAVVLELIQHSARSRPCHVPVPVPTPRLAPAPPSRTGKARDAIPANRHSFRYVLHGAPGYGLGRKYMIEESAKHGLRTVHHAKDPAVDMIAFGKPVLHFQGCLVGSDQVAACAIMSP